MKRLKLFVWSVLNLSMLGPLVQLSLRSELLENGWFRSFRSKRSVDKYGNPIPWYCYTVIQFIAERMHKNLTVFEYGAGHSTLWYASRAKTVHAVESDPDWIKILEPQLPPNVSITYREVESDEYVRESETKGLKHDVIVVDGRRRNECIRHSLSSLSPEGIIILDNSEREEYSDGKALLAEAGFKSISFKGLTPITANASCTSIFYRPNNCFGI